MTSESAFNQQGGTSRKLFTAMNFVVYAFLLGLGAIQFYMCQRADDFFRGDTTYFELARSLFETGFYGFNFKPETLLPPGLPMILASLCVTVGCTYTVLIRSMAVFATLGFIASYELLRREEGRTVAAVFCLLLASSPIVFAFSTRLVFSDMPYFFTSMLALLLVMQLDAAKNPHSRGLLSLLCGVCIASSLLIRSSGIALLAGLFAWLTVSRFAEREVRLRRLRTFVPVLLIGLFVEILWMTWAGQHEVLQWPMVGGYPQSYIKQLEMKNGNEPELGKASPSDILTRVENNLAERAAALTQVLTRKDYINPAWVSPLVLLPIGLIVLGVACSIWPSGGGLPEWYFTIHEGMYLLWPWNFELRFFLPIAPLACLYLWRGGKALFRWASQLKSRAAGAWSFFLSITIAVYAVTFAWRSRTVQPELAAMFWVVWAMVSAWVAWTGSYRYPDALAPLRAWWGKRLSFLNEPLTVKQLSGVLIVAVLLVLGTVQEISIGQENLKFDLTKTPSYPDVRGAKWIRANTASTAVVMARQLDVVYHYSGRRVIWFPPVSDAHLLMEGIHKYKVEFVIVSFRKDSYWLPREQESFEALVRAYPGAFQLVHGEPRLEIYKIIPDFT